MSTIEPSEAAGASAAPEAVAVGQMGVEPREPGTAGALNNVSQQLGSAMGVALISTFVATATSHYLTRHGSTAVAGATVHGFTVRYWWAAGIFWAAAVLCSAPIAGRIAAPTTTTRTTTDRKASSPCPSWIARSQ